MEYLYVIGAGLLVGTLVAMRSESIPWIAFALAFFIAPLASMFPPPLDKVHWGLTMFYLWAWLVVGVRTLLGKVQRKPYPVPLPVVFLFAFVFCAALGSAYSLRPLEIAAAGRYYFQEWAVVFVILLLVGEEKKVRILAVAFLGLAAVQPLLAGFQQISLSGEMFSGDRIGGSFGVRLGGGAILSLFLVTQIVVLAALVRHRQIRPLWGILGIFWLCLPLLWTHAKAMVVMIPVGILTLFATDLRKRPVVAAAAVSVSIMVSGALSYVYFTTSGQYYAKEEYAPQTFRAFVDGSLGYALLSTGREELNRGTSLLHWLRSRDWSVNLLETLVGHGIGSSKEGLVVHGHLQEDPRYGRKGMDYTAVSRLLWEVGALGTAAFLGVFLSAIIAAGRLSKSPRVPELHRGLLSGYQAALVMMIVALLWKDFLVDSVFGALAAFFIGYVLYWSATVRAEARAFLGQQEPSRVTVVP